MAAQLPPLPSPRSRQTEPPRVGLGRLKKLGRFYFAALAGASLCLLLLQLAAGLGPHRQVILRAQTTVRHSCACAVAQRRAGGRNRGSGSRGRGAAAAGGQGEARACRGCTMRRRRSVSLSSSASDGWYPAHTTHRLSDYPPTPAHSDSPAFRSRAVCQLDTRATHLCGSCPTLGRSGGRARGGSPG